MNTYSRIGLVLSAPKFERPGRAIACFKTSCSRYGLGCMHEITFSIFLQHSAFPRTIICSCPQNSIDSKYTQTIKRFITSMQTMWKILKTSKRVLLFSVQKRKNQIPKKMLFNYSQKKGFLFCLVFYHRISFYIFLQFIWMIISSYLHSNPKLTEIIDWFVFFFHLTFKDCWLVLEVNALLSAIFASLLRMI